MKIAIVAFTALMLLGTSAFAAEKVNSKESLRICQQAMEADLENGYRYKFKRNSATSVDAEKFTHWINVTKMSDSEKQTLKVLCETSRSGEVMQLNFEPGRWKI